MKYYIIYFIDYRNNDIVHIKEMYRSRDDAVLNTERVVIEYIRNLQGKQQADVCKQTKTPDEILSDINLKEGYYVNIEDYDVTLYEKCSVIMAGTLWNSYGCKIEKAGLFSITEYNFDDLIFRSNCGCMGIKKKINKLPKPEVKKDTYVDELKKKIANGEIKLNYISKGEGKPTDYRVSVCGNESNYYHNSLTHMISDELNNERILGIVSDTFTKIKSD